MAKAKLNVEAKDKRHIELFKQVHPKTSKGMSDEEIEVLGDEIDAIHNDETSRKFKDVFSDPQGNKFMIVTEGEKEMAIPLMQLGGKDNG